VLPGVDLNKAFKAVITLCGTMELPQDNLGGSADLRHGNPGECDNPTPEEEDVSRPSTLIVINPIFSRYVGFPMTFNPPVLAQCRVWCMPLRSASRRVLRELLRKSAVSIRVKLLYLKIYTACLHGCMHKTVAGDPAVVECRDHAVPKSGIVNPRMP
jgi:hypothetical protein